MKLNTFLDAAGLVLAVVVSDLRFLNEPPRHRRHQAGTSFSES